MKLLNKYLGHINIRHLAENNETYTSHLTFALRVATDLCFAGVCFIVHGIIPCWSPPESMSLKAMSRKFQGWNDYVIKRLDK
jgi:hypothetical protein